MKVTIRYLGETSTLDLNVERNSDSLVTAEAVTKAWVEFTADQMAEADGMPREDYIEEYEVVDHTIRARYAPDILSWTARPFRGEWVEFKAELS